MASARLPGKVLRNIAGEPMLVQVVERVKKAKTIDQVIVATTISHADNEIEQLCRLRDYEFSRGDEKDVLDRFYQTARDASAGIIVRITSDCPLIDPDVIDEVVTAMFNGSEEIVHFTSSSTHKKMRSVYDFVANRLPPPWKRTYPIGLDVEVCTFSALESAWKEAKEPYQREHVMPYIYTSGNKFRVHIVENLRNYGAMRWTVDTSEDLVLVREVYSHFNDVKFSWLDVIELFDKKPELAKINTAIQQKHLKA